MMEYRDYFAESWMGKSSPQQQQQATAQANLFNQQAAFYNQLSSMFTQQFGQYQNSVNFLQNQIKPMIQDPTGTGNAAVTAMRTSASENNSTAFQNALQAYQGRGLAMGSNTYNPGAFTQGLGELYSGQATQEASSQNQITQSNYWNAMNEYNNTTNMQNPYGLLSGANSAGGAATASGSAAYNALSNAYQPFSFLGMLGGAAGGGAGAMSGPMMAAMAA